MVLALEEVVRKVEEDDVETELEFSPGREGKDVVELEDDEDAKVDSPSATEVEVPAGFEGLRSCREVSLVEAVHELESIVPPELPVAEASSSLGTRGS